MLFFYILCRKKLVMNRKYNGVIPAKAGIQNLMKILDTVLQRHDLFVFTIDLKQEQVFD